jgi:hypothetical protein
MAQKCRFSQSFNNLTHAQTAVAEGSFLIASAEMGNAFRRELSILRKQIAAGGSAGVAAG